MSDDPVVLALRAALAATDSTAVRNALGEHLRRTGAVADALVEFEAALRLSPADRQALEGAAACAEAAGDPARAAAYRLALGTAPGASPMAVPAAIPPPATGERPRLRLVPSDGAPPDDDDDPPPITFAQVGGMADVKERLSRSFLLPLRNPDLYKRYGKAIGGGLVLYGPPGCGKTFLARAVAGEIGARFVNVGLSDVLDLWYGESERKLHELFEEARRRAPTVLFFDEVDALGQRRSHLKGSAGRTLVNQLLAELDGFAGRNQGVFFLAATNHPWDLDPALRRPGRFDRLLFVPPPDADARREILTLKLAGRPVAPGLDLSRAARATGGYSGADLEAVVGAATELAIADSLARGADVPLDDALLARAAKEVRPSTRPWFETARNHALYANEGGVYDELVDHLRAMKLA